MLEVSELGLPPARLKIQTQNSPSPSTPTVLSVRDCGLGAGLLPSHLLPAVKVTLPRHAGTDLSLEMVLCLSVSCCAASVACFEPHVETGGRPFPRLAGKLSSPQPPEQLTPNYS